MSLMRRQRAHAFTPIELLLVVASVSLMIAVIVPMLRQIRPHSEMTICLRNLRAQGVAQGMYTADSGGWIPCGILSNYPQPGDPLPQPYVEWGTAHHALLPYMGYDNEFGTLEVLWANQRTRLGRAFASIDEYQCPRYPDPDSDLDYLANAMPIPFTDLNWRESQWEPGEPCFGLAIGSVYYIGLRNADALNAAVDLSRYVYMTEVDAAINADGGVNPGRLSPDRARPPPPLRPQQPVLRRPRRPAHAPTNRSRLPASGGRPIALLQSVRVR